MDTTNDRIAHAPLPTEGELRRRRSLVAQLTRFVGTSWTMWRLARRHR
ncbi:hypothetical protein [Demequina soli]|nr:hypothetical protein [Demequina soli]